MSIAFNPTTALASQTRLVRTRLRADPAEASCTQGALALTYTLPNGLPAEPRPPLMIVPDPAADAPPSAEAWAGTFLQAVVEAVSNDRPVAQLARWTSSRVYADLDARRKRVADQLSSSGKGHRIGRHHVASVRVCQVDLAIAEVSGRVVTGRRSRALAARLEFLQSRWMCTELVFG